MSVPSASPEWLPDGWVELDPVYRRHDPAAVAQAWARLGVSPAGAFLAFYERYRGIIGADSRGMELLDLHNDDTDPPDELSVVRATEACREAHAIPHRYLCISTYVANSVLMYDTTTDEVFDMDFEGSDELLRQERLTADWPTFRDFLTYYFGLDGR